VPLLLTRLFQLFTYLRDRMGYQTDEAASATTAFSGTAYGTAIVGAIVADRWLGRFWTVMLFSTIYQVGMVLLVLSPAIFSPAYKTSADGSMRLERTPTATQDAVLWTALYLVALGTGGIKPNVSTFGADQFEKGNERHDRLKGKYWSYLYVTVNIGSLVATTAVVAVQDKGMWTLGFLIPCCTLAFSILAFGSGYKRFKHLPSARAAAVLARASGDLQPAGPAGPRAWAHEHRAKIRVLLHAVPFVLMDGVFWSAYMQLPSTFLAQGIQMDNLVAGFHVPPASMTAFDIGAVLIFIPLFDASVFPRLRKAGIAVTPARRILAGFGFAVLAMLAASFCETARQAAWSAKPPRMMTGSYQPGSGDLYCTAEDYEEEDGVQSELLKVKVSILWQIPQSEFFYSFAPPELRSICMAMRLAATALGGYFASFEIALIKLATGTDDNGVGGWIPNDLNCGRLHLFYITLAVLLGLDMIVFGVVAQRSPLTRGEPLVQLQAAVPTPAGNEDTLPVSSESNAEDKL
jgi:solute carrier family 15 (peptide/histidine transporter), member 3/4